MQTRRTLLAAAAASAALAPLARPALAQGLRKVRIAGGGITIYGYMPFFIAQSKGLFAKHGIDAEIAQFPGGSRAMQAVVGGSSDVACGYYEHTILMAAKGAKLTAFVLQTQNSGLVLGVRQALADKVKGPADLAGLKIGVSAPGSSTQLFMQQVLVKAGLKPNACAAIGVGTTQTAISAFQRGEVDGLSLFDPLIADLEAKHEIKVIADARDSAGTRAIYGGPYAAGSLYAETGWLDKNPEAAKGCAAAIIEAVDFLKAATPQEAIAALPNGMCFLGQDVCEAGFTHNRDAFAHSGKVTPEMALTVERALSAFDPTVANARIDLAATYTDRFVG